MLLNSIFCSTIVRTLPILVVAWRPSQLGKGEEGKLRIFKGHSSTLSPLRFSKFAKRNDDGDGEACWWSLLSLVAINKSMVWSAQFGTGVVTHTLELYFHCDQNIFCCSIIEHRKDNPAHPVLEILLVM